MIERLVYLFGFLILWSISTAQSLNIGIPFIQSYPKDVYQSGTQNWDIIQDKEGRMYFANNNGLMYFDGSLWKTYPLPNSTIVRSVAVSKDGSIYVGGQNEFGLFSPNKNGVLEFHSLKNKIPEEHRGFEDVWNIVLIDDTILFRASSKLFQIADDKCTVFDELSITYLGAANNMAFVYDPRKGLYSFSNNKFVKTDGDDLIVNKMITGLLGNENEVIITTQNYGLFKLIENKISPWRTDGDPFLIKNHITSASISRNGQLAFGTDFAGVLIMDLSGKSRFHLDKNTDLLNNKVSSIFFDENQNLWIGVDNGINYVEINSPFTRVFPDGNLEGAGFATKIFKGNIYFGTNNGLYRSEWKSYYDPLKPTDFELVNGTKGQNWGLDIIGDNLFLGHNNGLFIIDGNNSRNIYDETGVWNIRPLVIDPSFAIAGTFQNFALFELKNNNWEFVNSFNGWSESSRFVEQDEKGNIWMAHPYKGVYKIKLSKDFKDIDVEKYGEESGLPSDIQNHLFKIENEIIICGKEGFFLFNDDKGVFEIYSRFIETLGGDQKIRRLFEGTEDNIWFVTKSIGVLDVESRGLDKIVTKKKFQKFENQLNSGFESVYPYDNKNVFITHDKGFIHYDPSFKYKSDSNFSVVLNKIILTTPTDSVIFGGYENIVTPDLQFSASENAFLFNFSATEYTDKRHIEYRYVLEGYGKDWSEWGTAHFKEFVNLFPGDYTFKVQARNQYDKVSDPAEYSFKIMTPWYASAIAYSIYGLLGLLLVGGVIRAYQKKYYGLKEDRDQTIEESKKVIGQLKEEKIQVELEFKQRELASTAMHVVQKNETLSKVKEELIQLKKINKDQNLSKEFQKLINMLQQDEVIDDGWEQFMLHFNQLHGDYYNRLKLAYPSLTPKDLKMCTYLRMNLSTKEMASLLNVTTRGIEASRYRLRKKIQLEKDDNLTEFLMRF